jgi:hypothetical protein
LLDAVADPLELVVDPVPVADERDELPLLVPDLVGAVDEAVSNKPLAVSLPVLVSTLARFVVRVTGTITT